MASRPDEKPLLTTGPFQGLNPSDDPFYTDPKFAQAGQNFYPNTNFKGFTTVQGRTLYVLDVTPALPIGNIFKFFTTETAWLYFSFQADGKIYRFKHGVGPPNFVSIASGMTTNAPTGKFVSAQQWAFFSDGVDTPLKIDTSLVVTNWGIVAPVTAPAPVAGSGGSLTPGGQYAYLFTFSNAVQESSAGPASAFYTLTNTPSTMSFTVGGGTTITAGSYLGIALVITGSHPPHPPYAQYDIQATDTLVSIAQGTVAAINADVNFYGVSASSAGAVITLTDPQGLNSTLEATPILFNAGAGDVSITPSTVTAFSGGAVQNEFTVDSIPTSADPQVTTVNIYRIGGSQSQFQLVGTTTNGSVAYVDTLADNAITGQNLIQFRDVPKPFNDFVWYQGRIWGLGYTSSTPYTNCDVWYSNYNEPWGFNAADQVLNCDENVGLDPIVGGAALPMMLFILKRRWAWGIFGTAPSDYIPLPLFPLGCASKFTIAEGYGLVFWLSGDGIVYAFDGVAPQNLSDITKSGSSVKTILDNLAPADFAAAVGFVSDRSYLISFPTQGFTLGYSLLNQSWFQLGFATSSVAYDLAADNEVIATTPFNVSTNVTQWFQSDTDLGNAITALYTTGYSDSGSPGITKQYRHATIYSKSTAGTVTLTIDVLGFGGTVTYTEVVTLVGNQTTLSLPANLVGQQVQISIETASSTGVVVSRVVVFGYVKRMLTEQG